jgi:hypothetical protein
MLKYTDGDGDVVTMTSRSDVRTAVQETLASAAAPKGGLAPMAPTLKITCVPCSEVGGGRCVVGGGGHPSVERVEGSAPHNITNSDLNPPPLN